MAAEAARDYAQIAITYAEAAKKDRRGKKHCRWVRLAAERFLKDLKRAERASCSFVWSAEDAANVCDFVENLPHVEGEWGSDTIILEPWQVFILANVFGFRQRSDPRKRRFNTCYIECARKNAKSTLTAAVALYAFACEGEVGPQVKSAATTGDQARIVWGVAKKMVERTPDLREAFNLECFANSIACWDNNGDFKPINAKASSQDGLNPHCTIIDELHAHDNRKLFDVLKSARGARKNPLSWYITTAGYNLEGVCYEQRVFVDKVLQGVVEADHYFGIVYTLDENDDAFDSNVWVKANPNLGVSVDEKELKGYAEEAKVSPQSEGEFKTKRCNLWLNAASAWLSMPQWDLCRQDDYTLADFEGQMAWIGADLADSDDIASLAIIFERDGHVYVFCRHYLPRDLVNRLADTRGAHYAVWAREGVLTLTDGDFIDHRVIEDQIRSWCERFEVRGIAFDQYGGARAMAARLTDDGYNAEIVPKRPSTYTDPAKNLEARVNVQKFRHDGDPCLKWMASNAVVDRRTDGSILPKKESSSSTNKIDGLDAGLLGMRLWVDQVEEPSSYTAEHGVVAL